MRRLLTIFLLMAVWTVCADAQAYKREYNQEHPLVFVSTPNLAPYSLKGPSGGAEGYEIDLLSMVMQRLELPFIVRLEPVELQNHDMETNNADLTVCTSTHGLQNVYTSESPIYLFTHCLIMPRDRSSLNIRSAADLMAHRVYVRKGSYASRYLRDNHWDRNVTNVHDVTSIMKTMNEDSKGLVLTNTMTQKWVMTNSNLNNLKAVPLYIPPGEKMFMSNDSVLMARIDSVIDRLTEDDLRPLRMKWFYPERSETGIPSWVWNVAKILTALLLLLTISQVVMRIREKHLSNTIRQSNNRLSLILQSSRVRFRLYDVATHTILRMDRNDYSRHPIDMIEFTSQYYPADVERLHAVIQQIIDGKTENGHLMLRQYAAPGQAQQREQADKQSYSVMQVRLGILRRERLTGTPEMLILTIRDVTEEQRLRLRSKDLLRRSQTIFNTAMNDMGYFNPDGTLAEMNERTQNTFGITDINGLLASAPKMLDMLELENDIDLSKGLHTTVTLHFSTNPTLHPYSKLTSDMMYEVMLTPVYDDEGNLECYFVSGSDVTETVRSYRAQRQTVQRMTEMNVRRGHYSSNIKEVIQEGGLRMISYSPDSYSLSVLSHDDTLLLRLSQVRCLSLLKPESKDLALRLIRMMDYRRNLPVDAYMYTTLRSGDVPLCVQIHLVPVADEQGRITSYYGLCRDVSRQMALEEKLKSEMAKAQETEQLKTVFLKNMSYQIRTPLNAVVGFAELFDMEHDPEDEVVFVEEIKKNSDYLLRLINNILYLSRLNARMVELQPKTLDVAECFAIHVNIGWGMHQRPNVKTEIDQPFEHLVMDIDEQALSRIIESLASDAARFTTMGRLKASLAYVGGQLMMTFDDTGVGISREDRQAVFDGDIGGGHDTEAELNLAISKQLTELMGGTLSIESELEQGTTIMVSLPCKATSAERRKEA